MRSSSGVARWSARMHRRAIAARAQRGAAAWRPSRRGRPRSSTTAGEAFRRRARARRHAPSRTQSAAKPGMAQPLLQEPVAEQSRRPRRSGSASRLLIARDHRARQILPMRDAARDHTCNVQTDDHQPGIREQLVDVLDRFAADFVQVHPARDAGRPRPVRGSPRSHSCRRGCDRCSPRHDRAADRAHSRAHCAGCTGTS
jgi:hypothetical protein